MTVTPRTTTTKQNLDPRCTYVPTRVKKYETTYNLYPQLLKEENVFCPQRQIVELVQKAISQTKAIIVM
jgi:hypothetical protein